MSASPRVAILAAVAILTSAGLASAGGVDVRYQGQVEGGKGEVELRRAPGSKMVKFTVRHIHLTCDDGSTEQTSFHRFGAELRQNGGFYKDAMGPDRTGGISMWAFQGRLRGKSASGKLLYIYDQGPVEPGFADCSTDGELTWSAHRQ